MAAPSEPSDASTAVKAPVEAGDSPTPIDSALLEVITTHAAKAREHESPSEALNEMAERLERLEAALEQVGRQAELTETLNSYLGDLRSEVAFIGDLRKWAVTFSAIVAGILLIVFLCMLDEEPSWLIFNGPYAFAAFVIATVGAPVALLAIVLKGAFRTIGERNKDDILPEHIKVAVDLIKNIAGK